MRMLLWPCLAIVGYIVVMALVLGAFAMAGEADELAERLMNEEWDRRVQADYARYAYRGADPRTPRPDYRFVDLPSGGR